MGDVVTALARAVQEEGHEVEIVLPKYDIINYDEVSHFLKTPLFQYQTTHMPETEVLAYLQMQNCILVLFPGRANAGICNFEVLTLPVLTHFVLTWVAASVTLGSSGLDLMPESESEGSSQAGYSNTHRYPAQMTCSGVVTGTIYSGD